MWSSMNKNIYDLEPLRAVVLLAMVPVVNESRRNGVKYEAKPDLCF